MTPKRSGDRIKTDRRDAVTLARLYRAGELTAVYVPREDDEAMRDLVRGREDAINATRKARQHLSAFVLRHGTGSGIQAVKHGAWLIRRRQVPSLVMLWSNNLHQLRCTTGPGKLFFY